MTWTEQDIRDLTQHGRQLRRDVVTMIHLAGDGHPGPSLSIADLVTALYFRVMRVKPEDPAWEGRDRFILSKGHACPALYGALARRGYFSPDLLPTLRSLGSILQGHPDMNKTPGVDSTSGSLGNGISIGLGMTLAGRVNQQSYFTYVIAGDGEIQEGIVWEAAMAAAHYRAGTLIVFVDHNGYQSGGPVASISGLGAILPKWAAFGWHCQEIDGHDYRAILTAVALAQAETERPSCILAHTKKGKGIPFMEADNSWHKRIPTRAELDEALAVLV
ncbi:MAG TPA: transketolase [Candidatus Baltobacteraceae bacterium]|nr:transketolase [Candidatus Baltobacteraceae bacterium]